MSISLPSLEPPGSKLNGDFSSFLSPKSKHDHIITTHPFNYSVEILIPGEHIPDFLVSSVGEDFYEALLPAYCLINKPFVEAFIRRGSLQLIEIGVEIDVDNVLAVTPQGHMILHLGKDSYESLGLIGQPSVHTNKRKPMKYVVDIDLLSQSFTPGKNNYERVRECLTSRYTEHCHVLFTWTPEDSSISASSVHKFFLSLGIECKQVKPAVKSQRLVNMEVFPVLKSQHPRGSQESISYEDAWEWLGAVSCSVTNCGLPSRGDDDYISSYCCPEPNLPMPGFYHHCPSGFISNNTITSYLDALRQHVKAKRLPWAALTVHGFSDAPVSWISREHSYLMEGDNIYTFIVFPDDAYWVLYGLSSYDQSS